MAYPLCPECGLKFKNKEFLEKHMDKEHEGWREPKRKGWCTPHGFIDFTVPVTYEKACKLAKDIGKKHAHLFE